MCARSLACSCMHVRVSPPHAYVQMRALICAASAFAQAAFARGQVACAARLRQAPDLAGAQSAAPSSHHAPVMRLPPAVSAAPAPIAHLSPAAQRLLLQSSFASAAVPKCIQVSRRAVLLAAVALQAHQRSQPSGRTPPEAPRAARLPGGARQCWALPERLGGRSNHSSAALRDATRSPTSCRSLPKSSHFREDPGHENEHHGQPRTLQPE